MFMGDIEFGVHFLVVDLLGLHALLQGQLVILDQLQQFELGGDC